MRIPPHSTTLRVAPLLVAIVLAGCGGAQEPTSTTAPTIAPAIVPTAAPTSTATTVPSAQAPAQLAPTETAAPEAPALPTYKGIPHGVTPAGFFFLGDPNAPITLTDYSDFL